MWPAVALSRLKHVKNNSARCAACVQTLDGLQTTIQSCHPGPQGSVRYSSKYRFSLAQKSSQRFQIRSMVILSFTIRKEIFPRLYVIRCTSILMKNPSTFKLTCNEKHKQSKSNVSLILLTKKTQTITLIIKYKVSTNSIPG